MGSYQIDPRSKVLIHLVSSDTSLPFPKGSLERPKSSNFGFIV